MPIDNFINKFSQQIRAEAQQNPHNQMEVAARWIHSHSTLIKTIEVAGLILGAAAVAATPIAFIALGPVSLLIAAAGSAIAVISYLALTKIHLMFSTAHSMKSHIFKPATYGAGRLYYQGDVPILELKSDDPYKAGEAHGYLLASQLHRTLKTLETVNKFSYNPDRTPAPAEIPRVMKALREQIPQDYLNEMQGLVDGYNKWACKGLFKARKIELDELILMHMKPDSMHFRLKEDEISPAKEMKQAPAVGCTVAIDKDAKEGFVFGRNMDWPSFNIFGSHSLIINRIHTGAKQSTVEVGLPGFCGTLTGMNRQGLTLAMNVCNGNTKKVEGMPAAFFNRYCLENSKNVQEVDTKVAEKAPLGAYHLSVADAKEAKAFHFNQGDKENPSLVKREWKQAAPLFVTNCRYQANGLMDEKANMGFSKEREDALGRLFKDARNALPPQDLAVEKLVTAGLRLPYVNNQLTTHQVVMLPQSRKMRVAFDNAFAGQRALHELDTAALFRTGYSS